MSFQINQIDPFHPHFDSLVRELNAYLKSVDGDDHEFYNQFNSSDDLDFAFVGYLERLPVTCAGLKSYGSNRYELKRMFTLPEKRRNGYSKYPIDVWVNIVVSDCFIVFYKQIIVLIVMCVITSRSGHRNNRFHICILQNKISSKRFG